MTRHRVFKTAITTLTIVALLGLGVSAVLAAPPANDEIANAIVIGGLPFSDSRDTTEATTAFDDPFPFCGTGRDATVWYRFTPAQNVLIQANTFGSSYSAVVSVYTGTPGSLNQITCGFSQVSFSATAGVEYFFMIGAASGGPYPYPGPVVGGALQFSVTGVFPPANDSFNNATEIDLNALPFSDTVNITNATTESGEPFTCFSSQQTVWYKLTATANAVLRADLQGSDFSSNSFSVYESTGSGFLGLTTSIACGYFFSPATFQVQAGRTYYLQAGAYCCGVTGNLRLNVERVPAPPNDDFATATIVPGLPFTDNVDTTGATRQANEPGACAIYYPPPGGTVWYSFTPTTSGSVSANVSAPFYTVLAAYVGGSLNTLQEIGSRCFGGTLTFRAEAGTTYYFQAGGLYGQGGPLQFRLEVAPPPVAQFVFYPGDPSIFEAVQFFDQSYDPAQVGIASQAWDFGDGATATGCCPTHRFAADRDYTVQLAVTTFDGRTASTSQIVTVKTHDVAITKFSAPQSASSGQTRQLSVGIRNSRYPETVRVELHKSVPGGFQFVGFLDQYVPVRPSNRTTDFSFSYTFTSDDARVGKVTFRAVAIILTGRDALPADNEAISSPTKVGK